MLQSNSVIVATDQTIPLFVDCWQGASQTTGRVLLVVHGLGEHGGRYQHFSEYLGDVFDRIYAMDHRGHGRSSGERGYAPRFDDLIDDLKRVAAHVQAQEQGKKLYLLAHSFGGLVALRLLLKETNLPFQAAIISAPLLGVKLKVPKYKKLLGEVLGRTLSRIQLTNEVNPSHLSHDPKVVEAYVKDRLVHKKITPRLYLDMMATMDWVNQQTGPMACPVLFVVPGDDRIVDSKVTIEFFRGLKYRDKELLEYPGMFHEAFNEIEKQKVFGDVKQWVTRT